MKKLLLITSTILFPILGQAQVGINNEDPKAMLDITASNLAAPSNTDGILIPRMDEYPTSMTADQDGMMVFITGAGAPAKGFYYYNDGTGWTSIAGALVTANTLDGAYDQGGAGLGRTIIADNGAIDIQGTGGIRVEGDINASENIVHDGDTDTFITFTPDRIELDAGGRNYMDVEHSGTAITFNQDATQSDFRVESDNETHMLFVDGSTDRLGINRNNPASTLHVVGNMDGDGSAVYVNAGDTQDGIDIDLTGTSSTIADNVDGILINHSANFTGSGARPSGMSITMNGSSTSTSSSIRALDLTYNGPSNYLGNVYGTYIFDLSSADNTFYGNFVSANSSGVNSTYGSYNTIYATGSAPTYGTYNRMAGTGTGDKYGSYNFISASENGTHYGLYSDVQNASGYAGYFLGRTSFGEGTNNRYLMPAADGTAGQVMTTDGTGQISFSTPITGAEKIDDLLDAKSDNDGTDDGSSIFLGVGAGAADNSTSNANIGIGYTALEDNVSGSLNTAVGWGSLRNNTGSSNTAFGYLSAGGTGSGDGNTAIGRNSLLNNIIGDNNTALGFLAGNLNTGSGNLFLGANAGFNHGAANNKLYIENTDADENAALIYGDFGADNTTNGNILRTNAEFQIGNPNTTGYAFPSTDGATGQVLTTDGSGQLSFTDITNSDDIDWYEEGTTSAPDNINDDIFTQGNVAIGKTTATYPLDVASTSMRTASFSNTAASGSLIGINNSINSTSTDPVIGVSNTLSGVATGSNTIGIDNNISRTGATTIQGMVNNFAGASSLGDMWAIQNGLGGATAATQYGLINNMIGTSTNSYAVYNNLGDDNGTTYGIANITSGLGSGAVYGLYTDFDGGGTGNRYGSYTLLEETGTGTKYGHYIDIPSSAGGTHYGIYSDVQNPLSYAGYFIGRTSLGIGTSNRYVMPATDGISGQVMTTDGAGTISFITPAAGVTASNGLTAVSSNVQLGGTLSQSTNINQGNFDLNFNLTSTAGNFSVDSNSLVVEASGDVGIGVANPTYNLHVEGTETTSYIANFENNASSGNEDGIAIRLQNGTSANNRFIDFYRSNGFTNSGSVRGNGAGVNYATTSDRRLKMNINNIAGALTRIEAMQPRKYQYREFPTQEEYGFIAQELQKIYPQAVSGSPDSDVTTAPMMVDYGRLTPILTAAIQELHSKVQQLENENKALQQEIRKINDLEEKLNTLINQE